MLFSVRASVLSKIVSSMRRPYLSFSLDMVDAGHPVSNVILAADTYKISHHLQYPPGTTHIYSYFESRGGKFRSTVFFGLQYILKKWFIGPVVTKEKISEAKEICLHHLGQDIFNEEGWNYILQEYKGYLPLRIKAVPEGMVIPTKNVLFTVENTDPKVPWLTNWFETLLVQVWYPLTVATISRYQKEIIAHYLIETAENLDTLRYKLHDFGFRGCSSVESAAIGAAAHMVNFNGSDTIPGVLLAKKFYSCPMAAVSIPASEHSTMTTWGPHGELDACKRLLEVFPTGTLSVVSDSYDVFKCCEEIWSKELKDDVELRGKDGNILVIRPDSGNPVTVILRILDILGGSYGTIINSKGYKMLPPYLRIIQGDAISYETIVPILETLKQNGWSTENIIFGSGGALLQKFDRDTQKCAFKCSHAVIDGKEMDVYKQPKTDPGKNSKKGRLTLQRGGDNFVTVEEGKGDSKKDILTIVFENGVLVHEYTFEEIRNNAKLDIEKHTK